MTTYYTLPKRRAAFILSTLLTLCATPVLAQQAATSSAPLAQAVPPGTKIVIADDANHVQVLLRLSGEDKKLASTVSYANFSSGPLRLEAIRAGAAQVGAVGDVPPILAHFSNANVVIVGAVVSAGDGSVIATSGKSGINTLADLKGKRIAVNEGTAQQAILLRNLAAAGLQPQDVHIVKLGIAEFADALRAGQIDAAVLKQPDRGRYLASAERDGARVIANAPGANTGLEYLYASRSALSDPAQAAAIRDFVVHWYRATLWRNSNQEAWLQGYLIGDQRLKPDDARKVLDSQGAGSIPGLATLVAGQQKTIDLLQAAGAFAGKKLDARDEFDLRYADLGPESPVGAR
ncbi:ABC transporter substrate-binding protein [Bordetella sp. LUAb4]|uniref:ABC transporter substrate-binding protein n=1 Tax=Bordetella sp. LUAb4 TaxID=2843195 RepID=UPI001E59A162|nr:ABC transporter substrate-binding protein [Bordetella sp. LUAb4]